MNRRGLPKYLAVNRCDRTGDDEGASNPKKLLELAETVMAEDAFSEDVEVVIVFDADVYRSSGLLSPCYSGHPQKHVA